MPDSAVTQSGLAGSAMFGAQGDDNRIGFEQLNQQRMLANQQLQADERRAGEGMAQFREGLNASQNQFNQRLAFDKENLFAQARENNEQRRFQASESDIARKYQSEMQEKAWSRTQQLESAQIEFARANSKERERLAPGLMQLRKDVSDLNAKIAAQEKLSTVTRGRLGEFVNQANELRGQMKETDEKEQGIGNRSAMQALGRVAETMTSSSQEFMSRMNDMFGERAADFIDEVGGLNGNIGYNLLRVDQDVAGSQGTMKGLGLDATGRLLGSAGAMPEWDESKGARNFLSVDQTSVEHNAKDYVGRLISRAISETTGDQIKPGDLTSVIDAIVKGDGSAGDKAAVTQKLAEIGVSPTVLRHAMLDFASALDGTDLGPGNQANPMSRQSLLQKKIELEQQGLGNTPEAVALEGAMALVESMQSKALMAAFAMPKFDLQGLETFTGLIQKALTGGGSFSRSDLAKLIPSYAGSKQDDVMRDLLTSDVDLLELEKLGADPFGQINRGISGMRTQAVDKDISRSELERQLLDLRENGSSSSYDTYLDALRRIQ